MHSPGIGHDNVGPGFLPDAPVSRRGAIRSESFEEGHIVKVPDRNSPGEVRGMLDQILPVQFIEGLNEHSEPIPQPILMGENQTWGLPYLPKTTYTLSRFECVIDWADEVPTFKITLRTDHKDDPSNIILTESEWTGQRNDHWLEFGSFKPVTVIAKKKYWICLDIANGRMAFPSATNAVQTPLKVKHGDQWVVDELLRTCHCMFRFYGRYLPFLD